MMKQADKILMEYGKTLRQSRVQYMNGGKRESNDAIIHGSVRTRFNFRRAALVILVAVMLFATTIIVCSALDIYLFNFHIFNRIGHSILINQNKNDGETYYRSTYIVPDYKLDDVISPSEELRTYSYRKQDSALYYTIDETTSKDTRIDIDTENQELSKFTYHGLEVRLHRNKKDDTLTAYMLYDGTFISIEGKLTRKQILKIIDGLEPDGRTYKSSGI